MEGWMPQDAGLQHLAAFRSLTIQVSCACVVVFFFFFIKYRHRDNPRPVDMGKFRL